MSDYEDNIKDIVEEEQVPKSQLCYLCDRADIVGECARCGKKYCALDTSKLDSRYCNECMSDIIIEDTTFTKTSQTYDDITDTIHTETRTCRDVTFNGIDWMFACKRLSEMSDVEAKIELEYHRAMVHFLESDLLQRSVKTYRLKVQADITDKQQKRAAKIENQTTTRTRKVVKTTPEFDAMKFAELLLKMGLTSIVVTGDKQ